MRSCFIAAFLFCLLLATPAQAQEKAEVRVRLSTSSAHVAPAVVWLEPLVGTTVPAFVPKEHYTLLQKNRTFEPHLLVIPIGSVVQFPNADPFYHNVFSLFDGKRFDLGLYEAGSAKSVTFSREGVSYIFCNIHPEMSAVVITLSTPLFAVGDARTAFTLHEVPAGDYHLHVWVEGATQTSLKSMVRAVHVGTHAVDLGDIQLPSPVHAGSSPHTDEYGHAYRPEAKSIY